MNVRFGRQAYPAYTGKPGNNAARFGQTVAVPAETTEGPFTVELPEGQTVVVDPKVALMTYLHLERIMTPVSEDPARAEVERQVSTAALRHLLLNCRSRRDSTVPQHVIPPEARAFFRSKGVESWVNEEGHVSSSLLRTSILFLLSSSLPGYVRWNERNLEKLGLGNALLPPLLDWAALDEN